MSACEVFAVCDEQATHEVLYAPSPGCSWPERKRFCYAHAEMVAADWRPPQDKGLCDEATPHWLIFKNMRPIK